MISRHEPSGDVYAIAAASARHLGFQDHRSSSNSMEKLMRISTKSLRLSLPLLASILAATTAPATLFVGAAEAKPQTAKSCADKYNACSLRCFKKYDTGDLNTGLEKAKACVSRTCEKQHSNCLASIPKTGDTKVDTPPDPIRPKGGTVHTPPTGGTKGKPKSPHRVNTPRAPSGGGVFHADKSGGSGGGPILKSSRGGGSVFRSGRR